MAHSMTTAACRSSLRRSGGRVRRTSNCDPPVRDMVMGVEELVGLEEDNVEVIGGEVARGRETIRRISTKATSDRSNNKNQ